MFERISSYGKPISSVEQDTENPRKITKKDSLCGGETTNKKDKEEGIAATTHNLLTTQQQNTNTH